MPVFAVCSNFVEQAGKEKEFLLNVLFRFVLENPLRISVDVPEARVIELYQEASRTARSQDLRRWLRFLGRNPAKNIEYIKANVTGMDARETFAEIASKTVSQKCILCWSLQDYEKVDTEGRGVDLIDRQEAVIRVHDYDSRRRAPEIKSAKESVVVQNYFSGVRGSTIVVDSLVQDSFNHIKQRHNEDVARALLEIAEFVNKSNNKEAGELLNSFNEEVTKPEPKKPLLKGLWNGLVATLPDIAKLGDAATKVVSLFT